MRRAKSQLNDHQNIIYRSSFSGAYTNIQSKMKYKKQMNEMETVTATAFTVTAYCVYAVFIKYSHVCATREKNARE